MVNKEKTVCFSRHRSEKGTQLADDSEKLRVGLYEEIDKAVKDGFDTFIFSACYGFGLICAEMVLLRQKVVKQSDPKYIRLIATVPFEEQSSKWSILDRELYFRILSKCDEVITISTRFNMNCCRKCNRYMVDNSSRLISYYNDGSSGTDYTVSYAKKKGCEIIKLYK